jgi:hypothetical protein
MKIEKYYIEVFNGNYSKYGGHWQFISTLTKMDYLIIALMKPFIVTYYHDWYDSQHHTISLGYLRINWGGRPFIDLKGVT